MELLLNLAWLILALPAYWLWQGSRPVHAERRFSSLQCLLALGCLLVILFPVVSATDDLRAMRTEMEESPTSKRSLLQSTADKALLWNAAIHSPAAFASWTNFSVGNDRAWLQVSTSHRFTPVAPVLLRLGRDPPRPFLG